MVVAGDAGETGAGAPPLSRGGREEEDEGRRGGERGRDREGDDEGDMAALGIEKMGVSSEGFAGDGARRRHGEVGDREDG